jgi:transposase
MALVTVISGVQRRRSWSEDQKLAVLAAAFAPGAVVSEVARQADVVPNQIYRWRDQFASRRSRKGPAFSEVVVTPSQPAAAGGGEVIVVEFAGALVRIGATAPPPLVAAVLKALGR